jgi:hypothetical protein
MDAITGDAAGGGRIGADACCVTVALPIMLLDVAVQETVSVPLAAVATVRMLLAVGNDTVVAPPANVPPVTVADPDV